MVYVTGDTHIPIDIRKLSYKNWPEGRTLSKSDYLIVMGDFGLLWKNEPDRLEKYWTEWLNKKKWTTLWINGNHENYHRLSNLPQVEMFGSTVGIVSDSIYHLKNGYIYTIEGNTFFCMGGADSIDRAGRTEGVSWWPEEQPSSAELNLGLDNLEKYNNKVDYILTHTLPTNIVQKLVQCLDLSFLASRPDPLWKYLEHIYEIVTFEQHLAGHWHSNQVIDKCHILYEDIIKII